MQVQDIRKVKTDQELIGILEAGGFSGLTWAPGYRVVSDFDLSRFWHRFEGLEFAQGNLKLGLDTLIFNMGPGGRCAARALGMCKVCTEFGDKCCYNVKAERRAAVRRYRLRQELQWKNRPAGDYIDALRTIKRADNRLRYVRFNESADFWGAGCVEKLSEISLGVRRSNLLVFGFTSRIDLFRDLEAVPFKVRLSGYDHPVFPSTRVIERPEQCPDGWVVCPTNCRKCRICKHTDLSVCFIKH